MRLQRLASLFYTSDDDEPIRIERTVVRLRVALASGGLIAITADPGQPALYAPLAYSIPDETARVARAAFPKGNPYLRVRDALGPIYTNPEFARAVELLASGQIRPLVSSSIVPLEESAAAFEALVAGRPASSLKSIVAPGSPTS